MAFSQDGDCRLSSSTADIDFSLIRETGSNACNATDGVDGNIIGQDPLLGVLTDNGGPTPTQALLSLSSGPTNPAIDAGSNALATGLTYDQRGAGYPRIVNGTVDMGAYEVVARSPVPSRPTSQMNPSLMMRLPVITS
ncbi:MAG: choice-of-anchor Q domain-containing protein [Chloroflexota bacterium]